jgi:hypothetical protein
VAKHRSSRWKRLRDSIATDPGHFAAGSAVVDMFGLLAVEAEQLAVRKRPENLGVVGDRNCERPAETDTAPRSGCARYRARN